MKADTAHTIMRSIVETGEDPPVSDEEKAAWAHGLIVGVTMATDAPQDADDLIEAACLAVDGITRPELTQAADEIVAIVRTAKRVTS
jgi:hypothetical protein